jgi:hypothetical protein
MSVKVLLKEGDVFSIPIEDGTHAFGQYVHFVPGFAPLIRVFDVRSISIPPLKVIEGAKLLFPPVFVGLNPPVRMGRWKKIGSLSIADFRIPKFRSSVTLRKGVNTDWKIWDENGYEKVGLLPPEYRSLELKCVWPYQSVEERIFTGVDPFTAGVE